MTNQEVTSPGQRSGEIMGVEWTEISYLRGQERMPVFTYHLASAFSPAVTWIEVDKHAKQLKVLAGVAQTASCNFILFNTLLI